LFGYFKKHVFSRLALLFAVATSVLVVSTYYVINWAAADKDNIFDMQDAYYHYKLIESWGEFSDTATIRLELENLKIESKIYSAHSDTICTDDYLFDLEKEAELTYWSNTRDIFSLCDFVSFQDSDYLTDDHGVVVPAHVSFGDIQKQDRVYPATVVETDRFKTLLIIDYIYPNEWVSFLPLVLLSIIFMLLLYLIIWRFLRPISLMRARIHALEKGDLDSKIPIVGQDELALLSKSFNELVAQIKKLLKQKERLLSDVSHEIKTPLAKIRLLLAMVKQEDKIKRVDKQVDYLDSIVTNILISDKLSVPYSNLALEKISIDNLLKQAIDLSKHKKVKSETGGAFDVYCDVVKMSIVIKNLLDNAEKYAPSDDPVSLITSLDNNQVIIKVVDSGPGIPENLLAKITKPYVRGTNLEKAGFGLGLSICKKVLSAHNGKMGVKNNKTKGACFTVSWDNIELKGRYKNAKK
jgi:signal transduction histidine kinase